MQEEEDVETPQDGEPAVALYDFAADQDDEMSVVAGEHLVVIEQDEEWWKCRNIHGQEGVVPASYVEVCCCSDRLVLSKLILPAAHQRIRSSEKGR